MALVPLIAYKALGEFDDRDVAVKSEYLSLFRLSCALTHPEERRESRREREIKRGRGGNREERRREK